MANFVAGRLVLVDSAELRRLVTQTLEDFNVDVLILVDADLQKNPASKPMER